VLFESFFLLLLHPLILLLEGAEGCLPFQIEEFDHMVFDSFFSVLLFHKLLPDVVKRGLEP